MRVSLLIYFCCSLFFVVYGIDVDPIGKEIKNGVKKYKLGDFNGALESFQRVEKEISNDPRLEFNKGTGYYKLKDYNSALEQFEKVVEKADTDLKAKAFYNLGNTYYKMGEKKKAIQEYLNALKLNPNLEQAKRNLELIRQKEEKPSNPENQEQTNSQQSQNQPAFPSKKQKLNSSPTEELDEQTRKQISKAEAERILESNRQDKIKRKKAKSKWSNYDDVFW